MPLGIEHFAQVARHPDGNRLVVEEGNSVHARTKDLATSSTQSGKTVTAAFKEAAKAHFGPSLRGIEFLEELEQTHKPLRVRDIRAVLSANEARSAQSSGVAFRGSKPHHVVLVGGGPRSTTQVCAELDLVRRPDIRKDFEEIIDLGGTYDMRTTIVEKQGLAAIGMGEAWNRNQQGTVNTGAEGWGYGPRLETDYAENKPQHLFATRDNPAARAMFNRAFSEAGETTESGSKADPKPRVDRAATIRSQLGREERDYFLKKVQEAQSDPLLAKIYKLNIVADTTAVKVDASRPLRPSVSVEGSGRKASVIQADVIRMNTGTTLHSPLTAEQAAVAEHSYIGPMSSEKLSLCLEAKGLLGEDGRLKPGTQVLTGGSGLSLYDQIFALGPLMGLTEADSESPHGYRVTEKAKQNYGGAILITSNTDGKWISPRHSHTPEWTQDLTPISNSREQHALFLHHQGEEVYKAWQDICTGTVAAATGRSPKEVRQEGINTQDLLQRQAAETQKHLAAPPGESEKTMYGAKRQADLSTILGMGLEPNPSQAAVSLGEAAPLTYKDRAGYSMHRAQLKAITEPDTPVSENNKGLIAVHNDRFQDITASPAIVHALVPMLMDSGIARYTPGSYQGIRATEQSSDKRLAFVDKAGNRTMHDFFLVSPTFNLSANPAEASLAGQVAPLDPSEPHIARVGRNRMLLRQDGSPLNVESYSIAGKGIKRHNDSFVGMYAYDVNNRESAVQIAPGLAYKRLAQQHLAAAGRLDPVGDVDRMYEDLYPSEEAYHAEVVQFSGDFESALHKAALMREADRMAKDDPATFKQWYEIFSEVAKTPEMLRELGRTAYEEELKQIPEFSPASRDKYFGRFVDAPDHVHQQVYARAVREAKQALAGLEPQ